MKNKISYVEIIPLVIFSLCAFGSVAKKTETIAFAKETDLFNPYISSEFISEKSELEVGKNNINTIVTSDLPPFQIVSNEEIKEYIQYVFGEDAEDALKIAECESKMNPEQVGDKHLMGMLDGELIGDSIGIFQIRTGDAGVYDSKAWSRAKQFGMTVEELRVYLKNPKNNIDEAKKMFDSKKGWNHWFNCKVKTGVKN